VLDQKRRRGYVWMKVIWQTGAASEHWPQRCVQSYVQHADQDRLRHRIAELNDGEIAGILNKEALRTAHGPPFSGNMIHCLRKRWRVPTVKINGKAANPPQWPDGTYSVQGAAAIGITPQVIFDWLRRGWLTGKQLAKGMPWQIALSSEQAVELRARVRRTTRSRERHRESVESPITSCHRLTGTWLVISSEPFSYRSSTISSRSRR
jgi:hypothetical protein